MSFWNKLFGSNQRKEAKEANYYLPKVEMQRKITFNDAVKLGNLSLDTVIFAIRDQYYFYSYDPMNRNESNKVHKIEDGRIPFTGGYNYYAYLDYSDARNLSLDEWINMVKISKEKAKVIIALMVQVNEYFTKRLVDSHFVGTNFGGVLHVPAPDNGMYLITDKIKRIDDFYNSWLTFESYNSFESCYYTNGSKIIHDQLELADLKEYVKFIFEGKFVGNIEATPSEEQLALIKEFNIWTVRQRQKYVKEIVSSIFEFHIRLNEVLAVNELDQIKPLDNLETFKQFVSNMPSYYNIVSKPKHVDDLKIEENSLLIESILNGDVEV